MVYVRMAREGSGTLLDAFRIPLPSYSVVVDLGALGMIVSVDSADIPATWNANVQRVNVPGIGNIQVVTGIDAATLQAWAQYLDNRYPGRQKTNPVVQ